MLVCGIEEKALLLSMELRGGQLHATAPIFTGMRLQSRTHLTWAAKVYRQMFGTSTLAMGYL